MLNLNLDLTNAYGLVTVSASQELMRSRKMMFVSKCTSCVAVAYLPSGIIAPNGAPLKSDPRCILALHIHTSAKSDDVFSVSNANQISAT